MITTRISSSQLPVRTDIAAFTIYHLYLCMTFYSSKEKLLVEFKIPKRNLTCVRSHCICTILKETYYISNQSTKNKPYGSCIKARRGAVSGFWLFALLMWCQDSTAIPTSIINNLKGFNFIFGTNGNMLHYVSLLLLYLPMTTPPTYLEIEI